MRENSKNRESRRQLIQNILEDSVITSQKDLLRALSGHGISVNQSSISRDLQEMHVVKRSGRYIVSDTEERETTADLKEVIGRVRSVHTAGANLLVLHTTQGMAPAVGFALDKASWPEVLGTISGDDTLFLATASRREQLIINERLEQAGVPCFNSASSSNAQAGARENR